jgi:hypothetical protein
MKKRLEDPITWMKALVGTKLKYWSQVFFQLLLTAVVIIVCFTTIVGKYWSQPQR